MDVGNEVAARLQATMERHAPDGYDPASDDMTIPFAIKLAEQDATIAEIQEVIGRAIMNLPPGLRTADPNLGIEKMRAALEVIAKQAPTAEMDKDQREHADFEGAYDVMVGVARAALKNG